MPISNDEFKAGTIDGSIDESSADDADDPIETEKDLVTSFLSDRPDRAFTEREIVLGVDFSPVFMDRTDSSLGSFADGLIDFAGDVAATTIVVNDIDEALAELVEEGIVTTKEVETEDGSTVYYRLA
ncbi:hypothetical protein EGH24_10775 [Halonotius terrestris]|uniref:Uncharacterized protein n=1 Tax=Halonotius terrestris TaxID=2487750 RepID=A0A8J8TCB6_9EURY|nr:hypothetical protein [Halonotius terrestris]TQQ79954.1 hypothetical protein EGH24_10775 [Halonotius terrestris]